MLALETRRRLAAGPRHSRWTWRYELFLGWLRDRFRKSVPLHVTRRVLDASGAWELRRRRVVWVPVSAGGVPGTWVLPPAHTDRTVLYLHGGGYAFGSVASHRPLIASLARASGARVLGIDYRLAPEHPCPAAIEDAVAAYTWLLDEGFDPSRLVIAGDSAGGGLTLTTLVALREAGLPLPSCAVLLSPWTDLSCSGETFGHAESDYLGTRETLHAFGSHYAGELPRTDPRVSPLHADLSGLPPLLVIAGGVEILLDDSTRLYARAREQGVDARLHVEPDEVHVYPMFAGLNPRADEAFERIAAFLEATSPQPTLRVAGSS